ncbi:MAG: DUF58 domain-containing protein [Candidatus Margulisiibacteriota bacterium]|nr:DUF58 domain-containing protein [Candidatus Margulisiibacteriota bacterium]
MNAKDLIKKIKTIDIQTKGWVDSIFSGAYHSRFKGQGVHFNEVRQYAYGDDVRRIDWTVTAKLNEPYVKEFEEERDLVAIIAVDMSQSQFYQSSKESKLDRALELAAILGFSAAANGDQVGLVIFTDAIEAYIPPKQGKKHMFTILSGMVNHQPASNQTDLRQLCQTLMNALKRRSVIFILSDFICDNYESDFRRLAQKHDVIPIIIQDPIETAMPAAGVVVLKDTETGEEVICDTKSSVFQSTILSVLGSRKLKRDRMFTSVGVKPLNLSTEDDFIVPLQHYFKSR